MADERAAWQRRLLPFMMWTVVLTSVFFSAMVVWRFLVIDDQLSQPRPVTGIAELQDRRGDISLERAAILLERDALVRRYDQAALIVRARLWTRFIGFNTGMLLAVVGAAFVLGRLSEDQSRLAGKAAGAGQELAFELSSASPGLILAVLGTVLIGLTIAVPGSSDTRDGAIYFALPTRMAPQPDDPATSPAAPTPTRNAAVDTFMQGRPPTTSEMEARR